MTINEGEKGAIDRIIIRLLEVEDKVNHVVAELERHNIPVQFWADAVSGRSKVPNTEPVPPFEIYQLREDRSDAFIDSYFWSLEDAKESYWMDSSDDNLVIKNYAGNVCWTTDDEEEHSLGSIRMFGEDPQDFIDGPQDIIDTFRGIIKDEGEDTDDADETES